MTVSERAVGNVTILDVSGNVTLNDGAEQVRDKVRSVLQQGQKFLLVNLSKVSYMDSAGLGELVQAYSTVAKQGGKLKLVSPTKRLQDLLVITKLAISGRSNVSDPALPVGFTKTRPSGAATNEREPFRTRISWCVVAKSLATDTRSASADFCDAPKRRSISPGCGVRIKGRSLDPRKSAGHGASEFSPSASTTTGVLRRSTTDLMNFRVLSSSLVSPGPMPITSDLAASRRT